MVMVKVMVKGNGKRYGGMSSSAMMRPEEAGADTASLRLNATTNPMSPHPSPLPPFTSKYGMKSSSTMMRPEEAGADTASLRSKV